MSELPRAVCSELKAIVNRRGRMGKVRQGVLLCKQSSGSSLERPSVGALNEQSVYITCRVMTIKPLSLHIPTVVERERERRVISAATMCQNPLARELSSQHVSPIWPIPANFGFEQGQHKSKPLEELEKAEQCAATYVSQCVVHSNSSRVQ